MPVTIDGSVGILSPDFEPNGSTVPSNGLYLPTTNTIAWATNSTERLRLDASGNLGLGVTPSAFSSLFRAVQIGSNGAFWSYGASGNNATFASNVYYDASIVPRYLTNGYSTRAQQWDGAHLWFTAPSGTAGAAISFTQAMTLDASGNLGIGTSSPWSQVCIGTPSGGSLGYFGVKDTVQGGDVRFGKASGVNNNAIAGCWSNNDFQFYTNSAERARIDSSGNLLVGTTSAAIPSGGRGLVELNGSTTAIYALKTNNVLGGTVYLDSSSYLRLSSETASSRLYCTAYSAGVYLATNATSWTSASDEREKDIIEPIENALTKVGSLRAVIGKYKTDEADKRRSFLIAQDVQAVLPEAVDASDPDKLGVQYTDTIPLLVAAIKELTQRLEKLENKNG